ncbi:NAD(P)H dehydrogenase (quinone) [Tranquillimonas rosea]|uniref:NAD(P)H dehydrogenase (Quinone) n=1 Tax=Tranquillimonas rosea TaxID=641238 RepID=A0A1H9RQW9_9RHOB|nr:NAD(P)H:quinone oxidoreductase [Tranquillimonas rosea]SER74543.1 NAD(P)H dehydrogenase (quinone) [Tranquillimonas rosea]
MAAPKIAIVFYTTYGNNQRVAELAARAAEAAGAEVRLRRVKETAPKDVIEQQDAWKAQLEKMADIPEVSHDDMVWADGYFFSSPTRFGNVTSQMRAFIDGLGPLWQEGKLANKTFTATTSAQTLHGGQESTLLSLYVTAMHWGTIIVPPAYADGIKFQDGGNPYGYSFAAGSLDETGEQSIAYQAKRLVDMTQKLVG